MKKKLIQILLIVIVMSAGTNINLKVHSTLGIPECESYLISGWTLNK